MTTLYPITDKDVVSKVIAQYNWGDSLNIPFAWFKSLNYKHAMVLGLVLQEYAIVKVYDPKDGEVILKRYKDDYPTVYSTNYSKAVGISTNDLKSILDDLERFGFIKQIKQSKGIKIVLNVDSIVKLTYETYELPDIESLLDEPEEVDPNKQLEDWAWGIVNHFEKHNPNIALTKRDRGILKNQCLLLLKKNPYSYGDIKKCIDYCSTMEFVIAKNIPMTFSFVQNRIHGWYSAGKPETEGDTHHTNLDPELLRMLD